MSEQIAYNEMEVLEEKMTENRKIPKKGAAKKWANRLKELGQRKPPKKLIDQLNGKELIGQLNERDQ